MRQRDFIESMGKALYGDRPGWMSRLAAGLSISPGHLNNLHKESRPMSPEILTGVKMLLVKENLKLMDQAHKLLLLLEAIRDMEIDHLTVGPKPDKSPDPQNQ